MKLARTWNDVKRHPLVKDANKEWCSLEGISYWVYLKPEYICTEMECGIIHEPTVKRVLYLLNHCVIKTI